jgi:transposase
VGVRGSNPLSSTTFSQFRGTKESYVGIDVTPSPGGRGAAARQHRGASRQRLARGGQDATWNRQQIANQLRSLLRQYFPAALEAFHTAKAGLGGPEGRTILAVAPTPALAAKLTKPRLRQLLIKAGRQRNIDV